MQLLILIYFEQGFSFWKKKKLFQAQSPELFYKLFLNISRNAQENIWATESLFNKVAGL